MQLMCRHSEEGDADCLGIFDTEVKRFIPQQHADKVPHMGCKVIQESYIFQSFAPNINTCCRFVNQKDPQITCQPLSNDYLLLISSRKVAHRKL